MEPTEKERRKVQCSFFEASLLKKLVILRILGFLVGEMEGEEEIS